MRNTLLLLTTLLVFGLVVSCADTGDDDDGPNPATTETTDATDVTDAIDDVGPAPDEGVAPDAVEATEADPGPPPPPPKVVCPERPKCNRDYCQQVFIPEGEFLMGSIHPPRTDSHFPSGDERPIHPVQLDSYCVDRFEVSLERYEDCVDAGACDPDGLDWKADAFETTVNHYPDYCWPDREKCKEYAVNGKSYFQAHAYCAWVGSRLCTEAEWERAANGPGPEQRTHPWGEEPPNSLLVNIPSVGSGFVDPVDSHAAGASPEGIFNMAGNVYEWVRDSYTIYDPAPEGEALLNPAYPPTGPEQEVIGRGSCFFTEPERTVSERSRFDKTFDWG